MSYGKLKCTSWTHKNILSRCSWRKWTVHSKNTIAMVKFILHSSMQQHIWAIPVIFYSDLVMPPSNGSHSIRLWTNLHFLDRERPKGETKQSVIHCIYFLIVSFFLPWFSYVNNVSNIHAHPDRVMYRCLPELFTFIAHCCYTYQLEWKIVKKYLAEDYLSIDQMLFFWFELCIINIYQVPFEKALHYFEQPFYKSREVRLLQKLSWKHVSSLSKK